MQQVIPFLLFLYCLTNSSIAAEKEDQKKLYHAIMEFVQDESSHTKKSLIIKYIDLTKNYGHLSIQDWKNAFDTKVFNGYTYEYPLLHYIHSDRWRGVPIFFATLYNVLQYAQDKLYIADYQYGYFISNLSLYKKRKPDFGIFLNSYDAYSIGIIFK